MLLIFIAALGRTQESNYDMRIRDGGFLLNPLLSEKYLDCIIFSSLWPILKMISAFIIFTISNYLITRFTPNGILQILFVICNTLNLSVISYRYLNMVAKTDIESYFGSGNNVSKFLIRVFCST